MQGSVRAALAALGLLACMSAPASSEEGMWTFDNFPAERMREEMGWAPDHAWLDRVMTATARMPGCSASNVSRQGLILTNHHCVIACITAISTADPNYLDTGFMARTPEEERRCPGMSMQILTRIIDVTERIDSAATDAAPEAFAATRNLEIARLERECSSRTLRCEVVTLYQGGRYALYVYRRFDDVRLVFAPEHAMAAFGGEEDNYNFPRYCIDVAFLRVYENGAPAETPNHLSMRFTPVAEDEMVLIAGNPGHTSRLRTTAELAFERDIDLPWQIASLAAARGRLLAYAAQSPDHARSASSTLLSIENTYKGLVGRREALSNAAGLDRVAAAEQDLQARVHRNRAATRDVGDAWNEIARAQNAHRSLYQSYQVLEAHAGARSLLFAWARDLVRAAAERQKPSEDRMPRYADERLAGVERLLRAGQLADSGLEQLHLALWLSQMQDTLPNDAAVAGLLGGESPETLAARLSQSQVADPAYRLQLWQGGAEAIAASDDPMVVFVRGLDEIARSVRGEFIAQVEAPVALAHERIARARFRAFGLNQYPEANFSPRLSYGRVRGWVEPDGAAVAPFTYLDGLYARATGGAPFALTQGWLDARNRLEPQTIYNLSTTTDVIGGNSGSPLLDREGRVIGVVFDGNMHSLGGEYFYDGALNRTISVSSTIIGPALSEVYGMHALMAELQAN